MLSYLLLILEKTGQPIKYSSNSNATASNKLSANDDEKYWHLTDVMIETNKKEHILT